MMSESKSSFAELTRRSTVVSKTVDVCAHTEESLLISGHSRVKPN